MRMPVSLEFDTTHQYTGAKDGIHVPIALAIGSQSVELVAKLDTAAAHCIFEGKYGEDALHRRLPALRHASSKRRPKRSQWLSITAPSQATPAGALPVGKMNGTHLHLAQRAMDHMHADGALADG